MNVASMADQLNDDRPHSLADRVSQMACCFDRLLDKLLRVTGSTDTSLPV